MSLVPPKVEKTFDPVPQGNHVARLYSIIHIGTTHRETQWGPKDVNKVRLTWELCNEKKEFKEGEGEKPFVISQEYTLSMNDMAHLRKITEGMLGVALKDHEAEAFDIEDLVGRACMIQVVHVNKDERTYANIASASALPKGVEAPEQVNPNFIFNYTDKWDDEGFNKLPEFIRRKMVETYEFKNKAKENRGPEEIDPDDIPF